MRISWIVASLSLALTACMDAEDDKSDDTDTDTDTMVDTDTMDTEDTDTDEPLPSIVDIVVAGEDFTILEAAVLRLNVASALTGGITVFAPTDTAFAALLGLDFVPDSLDDISDAALAAVLYYHVLPSEVNAAAALSVANGAGTAESLGGTLDLTTDGTDLFVDGIKVDQPDVQASDGIIHVIGGVLVPDLVDVVSSDGQLSTLLDAVTAADAGVLTALQGEGPITLFAPTNDAFNTLLSENSLTDLPSAVTALGGVDDLTGLLQYHAHTELGRITAATAISVNGSSISTLNTTYDIAVGGNGTDTVVLNDGEGNVYSIAGVNTATVVAADIITTNGIIHKIDRVIVPFASEAIVVEN